MNNKVEEYNNMDLSNIFLKKNIDNDDNINKDLNKFQKLNNMFFEYTKKELQYVNEDIKDLYKEKEEKYYDNELFSICSRKYEKIIKMQKDRFQKFNINRNITIQEDKKQQVKKEFSKNTDGTSVAIHKNAIIREEYECYDDVIYNNKEKVCMQYLLNYNKGDNGLIDGYNIKYLNETFKGNIIKNVLILFLYLLFLTGLFFKVKSIGDSVFFGKFIVLSIILTIMIIRVVPKVRKKKNKKRIKVKDSSKERDFANKFPLISLDTFLLDLSCVIKAIHYTNNETDVEKYVEDIDLFDVIKLYTNIIECSISDIKLLNITQDNKYIKINIRCISKLYKFTSESNDNSFLNKRNNKNCNNIKINYEETLITVRTLRDNKKENDFKICEYRILK